MNVNIEDIEFTVFDTETTGLEPESGDRIVEIAAIRFKGQEKIGEFQTLVNPQRPISQAAFEVNRITPEMLKNSPQIKEVLLKFLNFTKGSCLCSYNAGFDLEFIQNESRIIGQDLPQDIMVVDILKMAKRLIPGLERYALCFVAKALGIKNQQEHRALSDVKLTLEVFNFLMRLLKEKEILDLNNFLSLFGVGSAVAQDLNNKKIFELQQAIDLGVKIKIRYLSGASATVTERQVLPKEIKQEGVRTYLVGHCCLKNEERTFRVDGILDLEILPT